MKKLSIVALCYNQEKDMPRFLDSVLKNNILNRDEIEIIVVDDGSTDGSFDVIKNYQELYPGTIHLYHNKVNKNQSMARNLGMKMSTAEYICFCDCDDIMEPLGIQGIIDKLEGHDVYTLTFLKQKCVSDTDRSNIYRYYDTNKDRLEHHIYDTIIHYGPSTHTLLVKREYILSKELWWEEEKYFWDAEDVWFGVIVLDNTINISAIDNMIPHVVHYKYPGSNSDRQKEKLWGYTLYMLEMFDDLSKIVTKDYIKFALERKTKFRLGSFTWCVRQSENGGKNEN